MFGRWEVNEVGTSLKEIFEKGLYVEYVYGTQKSNVFFLWISKGLILFMVCIGTVMGFFDAFDFEYNKTLIVFYTAALSIIISLLFYHDKCFYIGVAVTAAVTVFVVYKFPIYIAGGFREISDRIRETYAAHYKISLVKTLNPFCEDGYTSVTVTMLLIIAFLLLLFSITVIRYMSFAETFAISFIILEFPMFINQKIGLVQLLLVMAGCIACGMLRKTDLDSFQHGTKAVLMTIAFSLIFSIVMLLISLSVFDKELGEIEAGSLREFVDAKAETIALRGVPGLFEKNTMTGSSRGQLGKVSSVNPSQDTDIVVSFVPYSNNAVYLPGFFGINYLQNEWQDEIDVNDFDLSLPIVGVNRIEWETFEKLDRSIKEMAFNQLGSTKAIMEIAFVNRNFNTLLPYYTFPAGIRWVNDPVYQSVQADEDVEPEKTKRVEFYVPDFIEYKTLEDAYEERWLDKSLYNLSNTFTSTGFIRTDRVYGCDYIYDVCLKVPDGLKEYLDKFVSEHDYFEIENIENYDQLKEAEKQWKERQELVEYLAAYFGLPKELLNNMSYDELLSLQNPIINYNEFGDILYNNYYYFGNPYIISSGIASQDWMEIMKEDPETKAALKKEFEQRELNDKYRLAVCDAIRKMLSKEYAYTLSPGMTPTDEDFIEYFLKTQKKGLCSHFASAAVMLLRYMGIPARYVEGYVIPSSLITQSGTKQEGVDGNRWYPRENEYNPDKDLYTVEVSDFYVHAWIEVYLEGKGFVPYEMTPLSYIAPPTETETEEKEEAEITPAAKPTEAPIKEKEEEKEKEKTGDKTSDEVVIEKKEETKETDLGFLIKTFVVIAVLGVAFWMFMVLSRKGLYRIRCARYLKNGNFRRLVYIRYCELVEKLRKKGIITETNPLPMDLCIRIAEYNLNNGLMVEQEVEKAQEAKQKEHDSKEYEPNTYEKKVYMYYYRLFQYVEKVLYSSYKTDEEEYNAFYKKLKTCYVLGKVSY